MADCLVIYALVHQPRRVRLPAQPLPRSTNSAELEPLLFDRGLNKFYFEKVAQWCYRPATRIWQDLLDQGLALGLGMPLSTVSQFQQWGPDILDHIRIMMAHPNCEPVAVEPFHAVSMLIDLPLFIQQMEKARTGAQAIFGKTTGTADTTEMLMSSDIYRALNQVGFQATFIDGRPWVMEWRASTHLYNFEELPLKILPRHFNLSDDVGYRFSNPSWERWPLTADTYAEWIKAAPGDFVLVAWDFETFGEHHSRDTGIFEFLRALPAQLHKQGITCLTPSKAAAQFAAGTSNLPLTPIPATWAGIHGEADFFTGNDAQKAIFRLMSAAYDTARMTGNDGLIELAYWLMQSDNLHWLQWVGREGSEADVSTYFTPREWMQMGTDRLLWEHQRVYANFISAIG